MMNWNMIKKILIILLLCINSVYSKSIIFSGIVFNEKTNEGIEGVEIFFEEVGSSFRTDVNGVINICLDRKYFKNNVVKVFFFKENYVGKYIDLNLDLKTVYDELNIYLQPLVMSPWANVYNFNFKILEKRTKEKIKDFRVFNLYQGTQFQSEKPGVVSIDTRASFESMVKYHMVVIFKENYKPIYTTLNNKSNFEFEKCETFKNQPFYCIELFDEINCNITIPELKSKNNNVEIYKSKHYYYILNLKNEDDFDVNIKNDIFWENSKLTLTKLDDYKKVRKSIIRKELKKTIFFTDGLNHPISNLEISYNSKLLKSDLEGKIVLSFRYSPNLDVFYTLESNNYEDINDVFRLEVEPNLVQNVKIQTYREKLIKVVINNFTGVNFQNNKLANFLSCENCEIVGINMSNDSEYSIRIRESIPNNNYSITFADSFFISQSYKLSFENNNPTWVLNINYKIKEFVISVENQFKDLKNRFVNNLVIKYSKESSIIKKVINGNFLFSDNINPLDTLTVELPQGFSVNGGNRFKYCFANINNDSLKINCFRDFVIVEIFLFTIGGDSLVGDIDVQFEGVYHQSILSDISSEAIRYFKLYTIPEELIVVNATSNYYHIEPKVINNIETNNKINLTLLPNEKYNNVTISFLPSNARAMLIDSNGKKSNVINFKSFFLKEGSYKLKIENKYYTSIDTIINIVENDKNELKFSLNKKNKENFKIEFRTNKNESWRRFLNDLNDNLVLENLDNHEEIFIKSTNSALLNTTLELSNVNFGDYLLKFKNINQVIDTLVVDEDIDRYISNYFDEKLYSTLIIYPSKQYEILIDNYYQCVSNEKGLISELFLNKGLHLVKLVDSGTDYLVSIDTSGDTLRIFARDSIISYFPKFCTIPAFPFIWPREKSFFNSNIDITFPIRNNTNFTINYLQRVTNSVDMCISLPMLIKENQGVNDFFNEDVEFGLKYYLPQINEKQTFSLLTKVISPYNDEEIIFSRGLPNYTLKILYSYALNKYNDLHLNLGLVTNNKTQKICEISSNQSLIINPSVRYDYEIKSFLLAFDFNIYMPYDKYDITTASIENDIIYLKTNPQLLVGYKVGPFTKSIFLPYETGVKFKFGFNFTWF